MHPTKTMRRSHFLRSAMIGAAALAWASPALATGGLDVDEPDDDLTPDDSAGMHGGSQVRVLVPRGDGRRYRGSVGDSGGGMVNTLPLEAYLLGVVPSEMPSGWPAAALQAQAVVARTFSLHRLRPSRPYDLVAGSSDQEYGGIPAETTAASAAVVATAGLILTYAGAPADVAYMACCGGRTEDAERLWGTDVPYLRGVADPYCSGAEGRDWTANVSWDELARAFRFDQNTVPQRADLVDDGGGGRPHVLRLTGGGTSLDVATTDLRRSWAARFPSAYLRQAAVDRSSDDENPMIVLNGAGRGHGVGLCQWGARGLAASGASLAQILAFYFPGTAVQRFAAPA